MILRFGVLAGLLLSGAESVLAQTNSGAVTDEFTYSLITATGGAGALEAQMDAAVRQAGGRPYAIWTPVEKPQGAPFAGLAANQVIVMAAWRQNAGRAIPSLETALRSLPGVNSVSSRVFLPIFLADSASVPSAHGFYVHREEHYADGNVGEAVRLSREAWRTWEPYWGVKVIGLFREVPDPAGFANLNRIVWYPSYKVWSDTRRFGEEPQSQQRFAARDKLQAPGSGVAVATDRVVR